MLYLSISQVAIKPFCENLPQTFITNQNNTEETWQMIYSFSPSTKMARSGKSFKWQIIREPSPDIEDWHLTWYNAKLRHLLIHSQYRSFLLTRETQMQHLIPKMLFQTRLTGLTKGIQKENSPIQILIVYKAALSPVISTESLTAFTTPALWPYTYWCGQPPSTILCPQCQMQTCNLWQFINACPKLNRGWRAQAALKSSWTTAR